jgi:tetratricopeptide (TPR) repeat protein
MTVVVKDEFAEAVKGRGKNPWRRLWQVPLLLAGLGLFGFGVRALVRTVKPVPFAAQVRGVRELLAADHYKQAIEQINVLAGYYGGREQQGELQALAGDAHFLAQQKQPVLVRENYERVLQYYAKAVGLGVTPSATMNERWGEAALALGDARQAIEKLEEAIAENPALVDAHARELVNAYTAGGLLDKAQEVLERFMEQPEGAAGAEEGGHGRARPSAEAVDRRAWAVSKRLEIAIGRKGDPDGLERAIAAARKAVEEMPERDPAGRILTWVGRGELERGRLDQAEKDLTEARGRFISKHMDDGRAAVLLGKINEAKGEWERAKALYEEVVLAHAGTEVWAAARFGRAEAAARGAAKGLSAQTLGDYRFAIAAVTGKGEGKVRPDKPELVTAEGVRAALVADYERASGAGRYDEALTFLALQGELGGDETGPDAEAMAFRLGTTKARRGEELLAEARTAAAGRAEKEAAARDLFAEAAAEFVRHSRLATMSDGVAADSQWRAAQLFDAAGRVMASVEAYGRFVKEWPRDARVPEGLLSVGRLYQSAGMLEEAIGAYERNVKEHPKTPGAYTSAVNVARCYMAVGDAAGGEENGKKAAAAYEKAEASLLSLVQQNTDLLPTANEFRVSLFTLGELYYRRRQWADAILRLEEALERYPDDRGPWGGVPRATFLLAESYRKSAGEIAEAVKKDPAIAGRDALESARAERLQTAGGLFTKVIGLFDAGGPEAGNSAAKLGPVEAEYLQAAYMNRAECAFDRGEYAAAIRLYDEAATRFSEEAVAVRAYVQIVNAYLALKEPTQAAAAAERGRWILKRIPDGAFGSAAGGRGALRLTRDDYEKLLVLGKN